ncbi:cysteine desulfurase family protein [Arsenicicoccus sp. oral taxon 190]|uniref:cysteine desulfurase family protein n=1 Tax=Arsenicicoccus sp. oral taxon 190 TaxID=1658671 RepID=UPI0009E24F3F|nr:cysteine desulfurase family protein [Arsenicicoccus sp. oral taxon 190]
MQQQSYLDHAATTTTYPEVIEAVAAQRAVVGNPSSLHTAGRAARRVVEERREQIADLVGARPSEVVFMSGGTEADNLAVIGSYRARRAQHPGARRVLTSTIEHHAVLDAVEHLVRREDAEVTWLEVDAVGRVDLDGVRSALETDPASVAVVSLMWANNEVGTIQPVAEVAALAAEHGIPVHTDAVQAVGHVAVDFAASGVSLLSLTGHKLGGPVGVGALLARRDATVQPLTHGGGQERGIRSGTLDVAGIVGLATALEIACGEREAEAARLAGLRDRMLQGALDLDLGIRVGGDWQPRDWSRRLPGNAHLIIEGCEGDSLLYLLDAAGVMCSTGSACHAGVPQPSHVLLGMGLSETEARGALRLTLGRTTTDADVERALAALPAAVERARRAGSLSTPGGSATSGGSTAPGGSATAGGSATPGEAGAAVEVAS